MLDRKLRRDLLHLAGPAAAAALVVAAGILTFVALRGAYTSLEHARAGYFERARFADVVGRVVRAPLSVARKIAALPGVAAVEPRVNAEATLDLPGIDELVRARVVSMLIDDAGRPTGLNRLHLRRGRAPSRAEEVVVSESFAAARGVQPGDSLVATIEGRRQQLFVTGVGGTPEYLYVIPPGGAWPDDERYAILWMEHDELADIMGAEGAFHDVAIRVTSPEVEARVIAAVDELLEPWGGVGAVGHEDQPGWRFIDEELRQLDTQTFLVPLLFLAVAAFILHMVLSRLVDAQREIIALLKAVGYGNGAIALHYAKLALVIVVIGAVLGIAGGTWLGSALMRVYARYFRFDVLELQIEATHVLVSLAMSIGAGLFGALFAVRRAVALEPAAAMQPPAPPVYAAGLVDRGRLFARLAPATRMILRQIARRPGRTGLSIAGIALAGGLVVVGGVLDDSMRYAINMFFREGQREDAEVTLFAPEPRNALVAELAAVRGVLTVEAMRTVPVRLRPASRPLPSAAQLEESWEGAIEARAADARLRLALDEDGRRLPRLPDDGVVLTRELARRLGVPVGGEVLVERLDERHPPILGEELPRLRVAGLSDDLLGLHAYVDLGCATRLFGDGDLATNAALIIDPAYDTDVAARIKEMPAVAGFARRETTIASFERIMAESTSITRTILVLLSSLLAVGIVYNTSRIALAERSRDLATLRVLGFTTREVSTLFIGEQLLVVAVAIPAGWFMGRFMASLLMRSLVSSDLFRLPLVTVPSTYAFASVVVAVAAGATSVLVYRRILHLDLIAVLKARE